MLTFASGLFLLRGSAAVKAHFKLPDLSSDPINKRMAIGSAIFGIGWGVGGFCPGPGIANLSVLRLEALIFVPLMLVGMMIAQRMFGLDK